MAMMPGFGHGMGALGWMTMSLSTIVFLALIGVLVWLLARIANNSGGAGRATTPADSARDILSQRYARGEIDDEEYRKRVATLGGK